MLSGDIATIGDNVTYRVIRMRPNIADCM